MHPRTLLRTAACRSTLVPPAYIDFDAAGTQFTEM